MDDELRQALKELAGELARTVKPKDDSSGPSYWERSRTVASWLGAVLIPLVLGTAGYFVNLSIQKRAGETKLLEIAADVLTTVPSDSEDEIAIRRWAIAIFEEHSQLPESVAKSLETEPLRRASSTMDTEVGISLEELNTERQTIRARETAFGNLITDAILEAFAEYSSGHSMPDFAIISSGSIRGDRKYAAGTKLIRKDILTEMPFSNSVVLKSITGKLLLKLLENAFAQEGRGVFPQVSGLQIEYDSTRPSGDRVIEVRVGGKLLNEDKTYNLVVTDFNAQGGDYPELAQAPEINHPSNGRHLADIVILHISGKGQVSPKVEGRIVDIGRASGR